MPKSLWDPMGVVGMSTSQGHNFFILSLFGGHDSSFERSIRGLCDYRGPKKCCLVPQNDPGSLGPKML